MTPQVSTDPQNEPISGAASLGAAAVIQIATPESVQVEPEAAVEQLYEAALKSLDTLSKRWAVALAEVGEAQVMDEAKGAAA